MQRGIKDQRHRSVEPRLCQHPQRMAKFILIRVAAIVVHRFHMR